VKEIVLGDRSLMPEYEVEAFGRGDITIVRAKLQNRLRSDFAPCYAQAPQT
jgi:hypothetical protein